ncbi:unnamed protein product [Meganyctiphanes norvegica]|uniref:Integrase catalytic domain-containing protein n=1 Tax=Meganyctiphanes norvegica TaxID=48144 RepID=A0AAV2QX72_MEGNR
MSGATGLIAALKRTFNTFGVPEELASDGGPEFTSAATRKTLQDWGIHHRLSSVAFARSNGRAEVGVKTMKRLLMDNTGPNGDLNTDSFHRAILQYRNTPDTDTKLSPAMCVFGRHIRDFIPDLQSKYSPHQRWSSTFPAREDALRTRHKKAEERLREHTRHLHPLKVGNSVRVQNQTGPYPLKWDRTGIVVEVLQFDQYNVKINGSNRITLRNRKFLRQFQPEKMTPTSSQIWEDFRHTQKKDIPQVPRITQRKDIPTTTPPAHETHQMNQPRPSPINMDRPNPPEHTTIPSNTTSAPPQCPQPLQEDQQG